MLADYSSLFRNKSYRFLWSSQLLSQLTIHILNFLLLIKLFEQTGSSIATSLHWVSYAFPAIVVGPVASALVDMTSRKKILVLSNLMQSLLILLYALSHRTSLFVIYGLAFLYSLLNQFYVPAELASLPTLVKKQNLAQANSLFFITQQSALVVGFGFAGLLNRAIGFENSIILCSLLLFFAFLNTLFLPKMKPRENIPSSFEKAFIKFFESIIEGYVYIKSNRFIMAPFAMLLGLQVLLSVVVVNVPAMAIHIFKIKPDMAGVVLVVPTALGAMLSGLNIPRLLRRGVRKIKIIEVSLFTSGIAIMALSVLVPNITSVSRIFVGSFLLMVLGVSFVSIFIPTQTFLQEKTPGGLRGRVFGNYWFLATAITVVPVIISGTISELLGIKVFVFLISAILFGTLFIVSKERIKYLTLDD